LSQNMFDQSVQRKKTMQKSHKNIKANMIMCLASSTAVIAEDIDGVLRKDLHIRNYKGKQIFNKTLTQY